MRPRRPSAWELALLLLLLLLLPGPRPHLSEAALSIPLVVDGTVREFDFAATDDLGARALDIAGRLSLTTGEKCGDGDTPCVARLLEAQMRELVLEAEAASGDGGGAYSSEAALRQTVERLLPTLRVRVALLGGEEEPAPLRSFEASLEGPVSALDSLRRHCTSSVHRVGTGECTVYFHHFLGNLDRGTTVGAFGSTFGSAASFQFNASLEVDHWCCSESCSVALSVEHASGVTFKSSRLRVQLQSSTTTSRPRPPEWCSQLATRFPAKERDRCMFENPTAFDWFHGCSYHLPKYLNVEKWLPAADPSGEDAGAEAAYGTVPSELFEQWAGSPEWRRAVAEAFPSSIASAYWQEALRSLGRLHADDGHPRAELLRRVVTAARQRGGQRWEGELPLLHDELVVCDDYRMSVANPLSVLAALHRSGARVVTVLLSRTDADATFGREQLGNICAAVEAAGATCRHRVVEAMDFSARDGGSGSGSDSGSGSGSGSGGSIHKSTDSALVAMQAAKAFLMGRGSLALMGAMVCKGHLFVVGSDARHIFAGARPQAATGATALDEDARLVVASDVTLVITGPESSDPKAVSDSEQFFTLSSPPLTSSQKQQQLWGTSLTFAWQRGLANFFFVASEAASLIAARHGSLVMGNESFDDTTRFTGGCPGGDEECVQAVLSAGMASLSHTIRTGGHFTTEDEVVKTAQGSARCNLLRTRGDYLLKPCLASAAATATEDGDAGAKNLCRDPECSSGLTPFGRALFEPSNVLQAKALATGFFHGMRTAASAGTTGGSLFDTFGPAMSPVLGCAQWGTSHFDYAGNLTGQRHQLALCKVAPLRAPPPSAVDDPTRQSASCAIVTVFLQSSRSGPAAGAESRFELELFGRTPCRVLASPSAPPRGLLPYDGLVTKELRGSPPILYVIEIALSDVGDETIGGEFGASGVGAMAGFAALEQLLFHSSAPLPNELALRFTAGASTPHRRCGHVRDPEKTAVLLRDVAEKLFTRGGYVLARRMDDLECPACASLSFVRLFCATGDGDIAAHDEPPSPPAPPSEGQCSVSLSLDQLGRQTGTDKSSLGHDFLRHYDKHLSRFERRVEAGVKSILEVGVKYGSSLQLWRSKYPCARILGLDINPSLSAQWLQGLAHDPNRPTVRVADQNSPASLRRAVAEDESFDVIVEDGGHTLAQQQNTLEVLFRRNLNACGLYILEDLHTSWTDYDAAYAAEFRDHDVTTAEVLMSGRASSLVDWERIRAMTEDIDILIWGDPTKRDELHATAVLVKKCTAQQT